MEEDVGLKDTTSYLISPGSFLKTEENSHPLQGMSAEAGKELVFKQRQGGVLRLGRIPSIAIRRKGHAMAGQG